MRHNLQVLEGHIRTYAACIACGLPGQDVAKCATHVDEED